MRLIFQITCILTASYFFAACTNDVEKVNSFSTGSSLPTMTILDFESLRTDSGKITSKLQAKEFNEYSDAKDPYYECTKGMNIFMYDNYPHVEVSISSVYGRRYKNSKISEARNNVVVVNYKNQQLNTEQLFWDENKKIIYSTKFCKITTAEGVFYGGQGFESDQYFKRWELKNTKGTVNVKDQ